MSIQVGARLGESASRRTRLHRRSSAALAATREHPPGPPRGVPNRAGATDQGGGAQVLRRWSVADLIARAGGAPHAIA
ncbi:MAG: hypothetical protein ACJ780_03690 [Solirubrobacteraceae bacterium]